MLTKFDGGLRTLTRITSLTRSWIQEDFPAHAPIQLFPYLCFICVNPWRNQTGCALHVLHPMLFRPQFAVLLPGALKRLPCRLSQPNRKHNPTVDVLPREVHLKLNMKPHFETINTKELRSGLGRIVERARKGASFLVLHRSRPAFQIVPADARQDQLSPLEEDAIYRAGALGRSKDGLRAADHDRLLYGR